MAIPNIAGHHLRLCNSKCTAIQGLNRHGLHSRKGLYRANAELVLESLVGGSFISL